MGEIFVEGLGTVEIAGSTPTPEEERAIVAGFNTHTRSSNDLTATAAAASQPPSVQQRGPANRLGAAFRMDLTPGPPKPSLSDVARAAGVGTEGAGAAVRFDLNLALGASRDQQDELDIAQRALESDLERPVQVRIGPKTKQLEFRPQGADQFTLVNAPGLNLADIAAAAPEAGVMAAGVATGIGGGVLGSGVGPVGTFGGAVAGEAVGEGVAEYGRLLLARERGLIEGTDQDIFEMAARRAGIAGLSSAAGGAVLSTFARVVRRIFGGSAFGVKQSVRSVGGAPALREGQATAQPVQETAERLTGQPLPLTSGQTAAAPARLAGEPPVAAGEALLAERAAQRFAPEGAQLRGIAAQQRRVAGEIETQTFGPRRPQSVPRGGQVLETTAEQRSVAPVRAQLGQAERELARSQQVIATTASQPQAAVTAARDSIEVAREQVFAPFRQQFDSLQQERDIVVDLAPFRSHARNIMSREGQKILPSISLQGQSRIRREATRAGLKEVEREELGLDGVLQLVKKTENEPVSLGEVQRALRDIRRELRRPGIADEPQRQRLLLQLKNSLVTTRNAALSPEDMSRVAELETSFAREAERFDRGIVGQFTETDRFGRAKLAGDDALNRLLGNVRNAQEFAGAVRGMPGSKGIMQDVQDAVLGRIDRQFIDPETGKLAATRLDSFLRNNHEALEALFKTRPKMLKAIQSARSAAATAKRSQARLEAVRSAFSKRFGILSADPSVVVPRLLQDQNARSLKAARRIIQTKASDRLPVFDQAIAEAARQQMLGGSEQLSAGAIDRFMRSETGRTVADALGADYRRNIGTLRNVLALIDRSVPADVPRDLTAGVFTRAVPGLEGIARFARVLAPPLSPRGRALTGVRGVFVENSRRRIVELLADPEKLADMAELTRISPTSTAGRAILGRLGFDHVLNALEAEEQP